MPKYLKTTISREESPRKDKDMSQARFNRWMTDDRLELQSYLKKHLRWQQLKIFEKLKLRKSHEKVLYETSSNKGKK